MKTREYKYLEVRQTSSNGGASIPPRRSNYDHDPWSIECLVDMGYGVVEGRWDFSRTAEGWHIEGIANQRFMQSEINRWMPWPKTIQSS